jgi:hypothetical protein
MLYLLVCNFLKRNTLYLALNKNYKSHKMKKQDLCALFITPRAESRFFIFFRLNYNIFRSESLHTDRLQILSTSWYFL